MYEFIKELWEFARDHKKFWMLPIIIVFLALSALLIFTQGSALAPFIYTLFWSDAKKIIIVIIAGD